jgi:hypothetical protein
LRCSSSRCVPRGILLVRFLRRSASVTNLSCSVTVCLMRRRCFGLALPTSNANGFRFSFSVILARRSLS